MNRVRVRPATVDDAEYVGARLRKADAHEIWAMSGAEGPRRLRRAIQRSDAALTVIADTGEPFALFGLAPISRITRTGTPWFLGTDLCKKYRREFLLLGRLYVDAMLEEYPSLVNYVHCENRESIRWLRWLGFKIEPAEVIGVKCERFHRFHLEI